MTSAMYELVVIEQATVYVTEKLMAGFTELVYWHCPSILESGLRGNWGVVIEALGEIFVDTEWGSFSVKRMCADGHCFLEFEKGYRPGMTIEEKRAFALRKR